jgi:hypothetical protein
MRIQGKVVGWGASADELQMVLPGDELVQNPFFESTHAISINAPPERVWPWLIQIGQGRAGFYSDSPWWDAAVDFYYRVLSREQGRKQAVGYRVGNSESLVQAWQEVRVGDTIIDGPPGTAFYVIRHIDKNRSLVLFSDTHIPYLLPARLRNSRRLGVAGELSDSFALFETAPGNTRLVRRMRVTCKPRLFRALVLPVILVWGEAITARNFLRGIKRRAERADPDAEAWEWSR